MPKIDFIKDVLPFVSQVGSNISNALTDKSNTDKTIQANADLAKYAYSQEVEAWNKQNEYNSLKAQMQRFKEAGLNPNLIYGQGNAGNATFIPKYTAPTVKYNYSPMIDPFAVITAYQNVQMRQAQIDNAKHVAQYADISMDDRLNLIKLRRLLSEGDFKTLYYKDGGYYDFGPGSLAYDLKKSQLSKYNADVAYTNESKAKANESIKLIKQQIEKAKKDNNWYTANELTRILTSVIGAVGVSSVMGNITKTKSTPNIPEYVPKPRFGWEINPNR